MNGQPRNHDDSRPVRQYSNVFIRRFFRHRAKHHDITQTDWTKFIERVQERRDHERRIKERKERRRHLRKMLWEKVRTAATKKGCQ